MKKHSVLFLKILLTVIFSIVIGEIFSRIFTKTLEKDYFINPLPDERSLYYQHDDHLGWIPIPNSEGNFEGSIPIHLKHNSMGFRDEEYGTKRKKRIAFLGDSFVWGYDCDQGQRFTDLLKKEYPNIEILNLGVSGFGTDQEYLLLKKNFDAIAPDLVFLLMEDGDNTYDNRQNFVYNAYFKPYYTVSEGVLTLKGIPVPKSIAAHIKTNIFFRSSYFLRYLFIGITPFFKKYQHDFVDPDPTPKILETLKRFLEERNVPLWIGFIEDNEELRSMCENLGVPCLNLVLDKKDLKLRFPGLGQHWTAEGHKQISKRITNAFKQNSDFRKWFYE